VVLLNTDSLRKQVYDYLKKELAAGRLKPGEFIDQRALQRELGISKTPLRDSLIQLEAEGFVTIIPCRGVMVDRMTLEDLRDIYQIAGALESSAFESAFPGITPDRLERMEELIREVQCRMAKGDFSICQDRNVEFHEIVLSLCGNDPLVKLIRLFRDRLYDFPRKDLREVREWEENYWRQHGELLLLFREGTAKQVGEFMREIHWNFEECETYLRIYYEEGARGMEVEPSPPPSERHSG
jgi:DNA-binding GntR family transcriptional regulator